MCDILFITPNLSSAVKHEINGTMILGSLLLADGFDVKILRYSEIEDYNKDYHRFIDNFVSKILSYQPKSVSFYTIWTNYHIVLRLCIELNRRDSSIHLILGGPQSSALAMDTLLSFPSVDYICTGEGENTTVPFFRRLLRNEGADFSEIPGLYYRNDGRIIYNDAPIPLSNLETIPYWDDRLLMEKYTSKSEQLDPYNYFMPVEVGRGCPYNCTFCSTSAFWRRKYRLKTPEHIVKDIRYFHDKFGYKSFLLSHDALTANTKLITELCDRIIESGLNINWECSTRVDCLTSELIKKMSESGLKSIHMGIETGSERMQKLTNKNLDLTKVRSTVKALVSLNIRVTLFFVYDIPEETEEDLNKTLELIFDLCDLGAPDLQLIKCMFNPGTHLTKKYYDQLVFDPSLQPVAMNRFGCYEEIEMIRQNKSLFTSFYHLPTIIGEKYTHAKYLSLLYQKFPMTARHIRQFYRGDYLKFYRDFHENNPDLVNSDIFDLEKALNGNPLQIMLNTIKNIEAPTIEQARELLRFEEDLKRIRDAEDGTKWKRTYGFCYFDYHKGNNIEQFSAGTSEFLMMMKDGKVSLKLIGLT